MGTTPSCSTCKNRTQPSDSDVCWECEKSGRFCNYTEGDPEPPAVPQFRTQAMLSALVACGSAHLAVSEYVSNNIMRVDKAVLAVLLAECALATGQLEEYLPGLCEAAAQQVRNICDLVQSSPSENGGKQ